MKVSLRDVAAKAGVSVGLVSHVLNNNTRARIGQETQERVRQIARDMGYRPNRAAQALVTGRSYVVAIWMTGGYETPYFSRALYYMQEQASSRGYEMIVSQMGRNWKSDGMLLTDWPVDGIIAYEFPEHVDAFLDQNASKPPLVSLGAYYSKRSDYVGIDYYTGTLEAVNHLLQSGFGRIAYFVAEWGNHPGDARFDAYTASMRDAGRTPEYIPVVQHSPATARPAARQALLEYIPVHGCPDAMFCFSDDLALGAYRALCDLGIRVPDDIALVGCDGIEDTEYLERPLSTIIPPQEEAAILAWEYLERRIADPTLPPQQMVLPAHLAIRASSTK